MIAMSIHSNQFIIFMPYLNYSSINSVLLMLLSMAITSNRGYFQQT